jgi:hypothetical protein
MHLRIFSVRSLSALAVAAGLAGLGSTAMAAEKGQNSKPLVFKSRVIHAPSASGSVSSGVAEALGRYGRWETLSAEQKRDVLTKLEGVFRLNRSSEGLAGVEARNGTVSVDLQSRFQYVYLTRRNPDGTTSTACVTDFESARAFLQGGGGRTPSRLEKE